MFSFHPVKSITSGEGGAILTSDPGLAERIRQLANHGMTGGARGRGPGEDGPWYYQVRELGFNARLSDMHAALGRSQLRRIESFLERRRQLAAGYVRLLSPLSLQLLQVAAPDSCAWHLFPV